MQTTTTTVPTERGVGYFDGVWIEDDHEIACRIADNPDGVAWVAATYAGDTTIQDGGYGIYWGRDDEGRLHYAVTDCSAWPAYAATVEEAWEMAVRFAELVDADYPADKSYDPRIPALAYGIKADRFAAIPTN